MNETAKKVLGKLERQCARREYCRSDIYTKALRDLEGDSAAAGEVTDSLITDGYVSDLRYASAFAREKSGLTGWGPVKIKYALAAKHIDRGVIEAAMEEIDSDKAASRLDKLLTAKWKTLEGDPQAKLKLIKFALGRGYEYADIQDAIEDICNG